MRASRGYLVTHGMTGCVCVCVWLIYAVISCVIAARSPHQTFDGGDDASRVHIIYVYIVYIEDGT